MALLESIRRGLTSYLTPRKPSYDTQHYGSTDESPTQNSVRKRRRGIPSPAQMADLDGDTIHWESGEREMLSSSPRSQDSTRKRRRIGGSSYRNGTDDHSDMESSTLFVPNSSPGTKEESSMSKEAVDRVLMPPPNLHKLEGSDLGTSKILTSPGFGRKSWRHDEEDESTERGDYDLSSMSGKRTIEIDDFDKEQAKRLAEATSLPAYSGVWAKEEKEIFFSLALRGFEPLLPKNWMVDFKTLPLSLYATDDSKPPLIQVHTTGEFRAIRALRDFLDLGKRVRDRALTNPNLRPEPIIERSVNQYISWALADVGMHPDQRPKAIPVHTVVAMKAGQISAEIIGEMTSQLHSLAARYRRAYNIHESIESRDPEPTKSYETRVAEDSGHLPILTGLMICSSLVLVVMMNAHTLPPTFLLFPGKRSYPGESTEYLLKESFSPAFPPPTPQYPPERLNCESGLRFIASFDFSDSTQDVWNALAIAIVAMRIRAIMVEQFRKGEALGEPGMAELWGQVDPVEGSRVQGTTPADPDA